MKHVIFIVIFFLANFIFAQELSLVVEKKKAGYMNTSGEIVIPPQFIKANSFSSSYAAAQSPSNKKWGFINEKGEWIIEPQYDKVKNFTANVAVVYAEKEWFYINPQNERINTPETDKVYDFQENGLAFISKEGKIGIINTSGNIVLEPKYEVIKPFTKGQARVRENGLWGMIDTKGNVTIPTEYEDITSYSKNGVAVKKDGQWGILNGKTFIAVDGAEKIWEYTNRSKLTYAKKEGKIGFIDGSGKWVIAPEYDKVRAFNKGFAPVYKDKKWGYINEKGEIVIDFRYSDAEVFGDGGLAPVKEEKLWGFIDRNGTVVIPMEYDITFGLFDSFNSGFNKGFTGDYARVKKGKDMGIINNEGEVIGKWFQYVEPFIKLK